jgi:ornithine cyclodeaminase/alanine dehydrogenase
MTRAEGAMTDASSTLLYLSGEDVAAVTPPMSAVVDAVEEAFRLRGLGRTEMPAKPSLHFGSSAFSQTMAAYVGGVEALGVKWICLVPENRDRGLPLAHAVMVLSDTATGRPLALMEAGLITALRTGASVAVAARHLARADSGALGFLGCGVQARAALEALATVLPTPARVRCYDVQPAAMAEFTGAAFALAADLQIETCDRPADVVAGAAVVVSAITMGEAAPPLGAGLLEPGALAVALDYDAAWTSAAIAECDLFVCDDVPQLLATRAAGPRLAGIPEQVHGDLAELAAGVKPGRRRDDERIFCMNLGVAIEDVVTAKLVYEHAVAAGVGRLLPL